MRDAIRTWYLPEESNIKWLITSFGVIQTTGNRSWNLHGLYSFVFGKTFSETWDKLGQFEMPSYETMISSVGELFQYQLTDS